MHRLKTLVSLQEVLFAFTAFIYFSKCDIMGKGFSNGMVGYHRDTPVADELSSSVTNKLCMPK